MWKESRANSLGNCLLFRGLSQEERERTVAQGKVVALRKGECLRLPERLREICVVLDGRFNVLLDSGMNESLTHSLEAGESFGAAFCAEDLPCHVQLQAALPGSLLRIPYACLMAEDIRSRVLENLLTITSRHLKMLAEKISHTQSRSVRVKLSLWLQDRIRHCGCSCFDLGMKRNALAEYLCVSYPAMARELGQMQDEGLIRLEGDQVTVLDEEGLTKGGTDDAAP